MYRFALRPRWIISHLVVLALVIAMVNLGLWQLRRLDDRRTYNALVSSRTEQPVVSVGDLPRAGSGADAAALEFRPITVIGRFLADEQVLVRSRSLDDSPGSWVLAPLRTDDGALVIVNRGWIANNGRFDSVPTEFAPPTTPVTITGLVMRTQTRGRFGPTDPPTGHLSSLARVDVARYAQQLGAPVVPAWVQQGDIAPAPPAAQTVPRTLGPPELDEGRHFGYAVQWFIFAAIALFGYPLILRRNAKERRAEGADTSGPDGRPRVQVGDDPGDVDRVDVDRAGAGPDAPDPADVVEPDDPRLEAHSG